MTLLLLIIVQYTKVKTGIKQAKSVKTNESTNNQLPRRHANRNTGPV